MRILVICPHYDPDIAPTGVVMTAIVEGLADLGHDLHVVTSLPWYLHHEVEPEWRGAPVRRARTRWGQITRVFPFPTDKTNIPARAAAFGGFTALAGAFALGDLRRPDAVLVMSPPITLGLAGLVVARLRRVPFVFNIQDVFPDVAIDLGVLTNTRVIAVLRRLERLLYEQADTVTVLSEDLASNVEAKIRPGRRGAVQVIPNFVDTDRIAAGPTDNAYRAEYGLTGKTVVMYAGNIGFSQSLDLLIDAAVAFADRPDVAFVINGGGSARESLMRQVADLGLTNVTFVGLQPAERLPEVLAAADLHVVPLRAGLARSSVPSKLYSILAAGRAVLASVDSGTEVARVIERAGAGQSVEPDDSAAFIAALETMLASPVELSLAGANGRRFVESWASPDAVARSYEALFHQLGREHGGRPQKPTRLAPASLPSRLRARATEPSA